MALSTVVPLWRSNVGKQRDGNTQQIAVALELPLVNMVCLCVQW